MPTFLKSNGRLLHYRHQRGTGGPVIVFANSLGTDLRLWDDVIDHLPKDVGILAYDKSGHGLSEPGAESIEDHAADMAALMDGLGIAEALVCGVSVGGMIAQALAAQRGDLVAGLALCNTGHRIGTEETWGERIAALDRYGLEPMTGGILERWFSQRFRDEAPGIVAGYRMMLARTPLVGYRAVCAAIRDADLAATTAGLSCPTLCVSGSEDQATPPAVVEALAALIPGAQYLCYDGVGHLPCIEAPSRLARDILTHRATLT